MAQSGWYPDPAGAADTFRYWDGEKWTEHTSGDPSGTSARVSGMSRSGKSEKQSWAPVIIAVAVLVVLAIGLWFILGASDNSGGFRQRRPIPVDTNSAKPTVTAWDEMETATPPPTTDASLQSCPYSTVDNGTDRTENGRLYSGDLSVEMIDGWSVNSMYLEWTSEFITQTDNVQPGWMSNMGIGVLNAEDGFDNAMVAARQTVQCYASSGYYQGFTDRTDLIDQKVMIGDFSGWHIRAEVRVEQDHLPGIEGDVVDVVVVDTGNPERMGVYVASITIGDTARQQLADQALASLRVER